MPTVISINATGAVDRTLTLDDLAARVGDTSQLLWIDFARIPQQAELDLLSKTFGLPQRVLLHLTKPHRGPRAVRFLRCRLVVIFDVQFDSASNAVQSFELVHLIGDRYLITAHPSDSNVIPLATQQIEDIIGMFGFSVGTLTYSILDALVDRYDAVIAQLQQQVSQLRQRILDQRESEGVDDVYRLTKLLGDLRQVMSPEEALLSNMHAPDASTSDELSDAFQDVSVDLQSAIDTIDQSSTLVSGLLDTYETLKSDALNILVKRLTVLSVMVALIGLIPALFGISVNIAPWPFQRGYQGYLVNLGGMVLLGTLVWIVARRIGWIK